MSFLNNNFISEFFTNVLYWLVGFVNEYWLAILMLTFLVRIVLLPVDLKQKKSARVMQELAPEVEALKKRYAMDQQLFAQKQQALYKSRGASPMAGCLPMLLSMVFLFAFYGALRNVSTNETLSLYLSMSQNGVENTALPSFLWIHNFWQPDSGFAGVFPTTDEFISFIMAGAEYITPEMLTLLDSQDLIDFSTGTLQATEYYTQLTNSMIESNGLQGVMNGWFGFPILVGVTMFLSQYFSMRNNPMQQQQGNMMLYMFPLLSVYICAISSTAFSIYWLAANLYVLVQNFILDKIFKKKKLSTEPVTELK